MWKLLNESKNNNKVYMKLQETIKCVCLEKSNTDILTIN